MSTSEEAGVSTLLASTADVGRSWFVKVRWGAAATQLLATLSLGLLADAIPVLPALVCLAPSVATNLWLARRSASRPASQSTIFALLALDVVALSGWLMLAGGPANPWSALYLVYVVLAAVLLGDERPWGVVVLACLGYGSTFVLDPMHRDPNAAHAAAAGGAFSSHLEGMYVAFVVAGVLVAYFVTRVAQALRDQESALAEARTRTLRIERAAAMTTLAAGAAHELGSPLATIAVAAKELERALQREGLPSELADDARLVREEVGRCRAILDRMAVRGGAVVGMAPESYRLTSLRDALAVTLGSERMMRVDFVCDDVALHVAASAVEPLVENLARNALDASGSGVIRVRRRPSTTLSSSRSKTRARAWMRRRGRARSTRSSPRRLQARVWASACSWWRRSFRSSEAR